MWNLSELLVPVLCTETEGLAEVVAARFAPQQRARFEGIRHVRPLGTISELCVKTTIFVQHN